jgi:hypothetical protein
MTGCAMSDEFARGLSSTRRAWVVLLVIPLTAGPAGAQQPDDPKRPISSSIPRVVELLQK